LKIAIISHTEHYLSENNTIVGWGPTIKELNCLAQICDVIYHIAPLHNCKSPGSALPYISNKIIFVPIYASGGAGFKKMSILFRAPINLYKIYKTIKKVDKVQFRAPTGIGIYVLPFLRLFYNSKYWIKYAGNWKDEKMPIGNKLQKKWLQNFTSKNTKITVNGFWINERNNIIPFENPCLDKNDRKLGYNLLVAKKLKKTVEFCFVGALNKHKGVDKILKAINELNFKNNITLHFVGDGSDRFEFEKTAKYINTTIIFHGFLEKDAISSIYSKCDFIILPSKSEGFPKVIGEAMNYGCIPIVSDVSCISQYIQNGVNGFLIKPITSKEIIKKIQLAIKLNGNEKEKIKKNNYELAEKFTYEYYNHRIKNEIFEIKK
jgi:glycosyltransferase involved in cell wall biosynthesis